MSDTAIRVEGLSKSYRIVPSQGTFRTYGTLRDRLASIVPTAYGWLASCFKRPPDEASGLAEKESILWALKDVSFEVKHGSIMGVIGRNGAGKTTLFKILSRITEPTVGRAEIRGRVGSLLEIGTGFHLELTGRENIYLNGVILGMKKREIDERFDEIVAFAEVEKFLDTPVKRYSSGMYVRLAFAVAAHLRTDILLVDEILSVGDIRFQKKCLAKIKKDIQKERTVLFVSHNMAVVNALCSNVLLLDNGKLTAIGNKETVIRKYIEQSYELTEIDLFTRTDREGSGVMHFVKYCCEDSSGSKVTAFRSGEDAIIAVQYNSKAGMKIRDVSVSFVLYDFLGNPITDLANRVVQDIWPEVPGEGVIRCRIKRLPLKPGRYIFSVFAQVAGVVADTIKDAGRFDVEVGPFFTTGRLPDSEHGMVLMDNAWTIVPL